VATGNRYEEVPPSSRAALATALLEGDFESAAERLLGVVLHDGDWRWCQDRCLALVDHESEAVRRIAVLGLGHLARLHRQLDVPHVVPRLRELLNDPVLGGAAEDALDDIAVFLPDPEPG